MDDALLDIYTLGFLATVGFVIGGTVWAIERIPMNDRKCMGMVARRPRRIAAVWLVGTAIPTLVGLYAPDGPVPPQLLMAAVLAASIWLSASSLGRSLAKTLPLYLLVGFQAFRLPLEVALHGWVEANVAPPQMTWTGGNVDIVSGVVALASIPAIRKWERFAWVPTVVGIVLLMNVIGIVVRSMPGPLQTYDDPITLPLQFPHVWIATVCVMAAVAGHIIAVRALLLPSAEARR